VAVMVIGAFVPMTVGAAIWYKRNKFSAEPRYHIFQDMDAQVSVKPQEASDVFADGRGMRPPVPGTVAFSRNALHSNPTLLKDDDLAYRGFAVDPATGETVRVVNPAGGDPLVQYLEGMPEIVTVNAAFLERGQEKFNVYCYPCHGLNGLGEGPVHRRATALVNQQGNPSGTVWTPPANLSDTKFDNEQYPNGKLFNTITDGANNMAGYGSQISVEDRWAIVAYVRALQLSQNASAANIGSSVPHDHDGDGIAEH